MPTVNDTFINLISNERQLGSSGELG